MEWQFHAADPREAHAAREAFSAFLRSSCSGQSDFEAAEIVFGELIGNAVRHARGPIDITVQSDSHGLVRLDVCDCGRPFVFAPKLPSPERESGRGLYIISKLCEHCSATQIPGGNKVSVVLPVMAQPSQLHLVEQVLGPSEIDGERRDEDAEGDECASSGES